MRLRLLLGLVPAVPVAVLVGACDTPSVGINLDMRFPQGLIDQASAMSLYVFDASLAKCDADTGHVDAIPSGDATQKFPLDQKGCAAPYKWCTTIRLDKDGSNKMFAVVATQAGAPIAEGCTTQVVNQDPLPVEIRAHRYTPPKCCGNGVLEPGEQCDTGVAFSCDGAAGTCSGMEPNNVCSCDCTAQEILLSIDNDPKNAKALQNGPAGSKQSLALAFGPGGIDNAIVLRAAYVSSDDAAVGNSDINLRYLAESLDPIEKPHALSYQLRLPLTCDNVLASPGIIRQQQHPVMATASSDTVALVYLTDEKLGSEDYDVHLTPQLADGCTDAKPCTTDADCQTRCSTTTNRCATSIPLNVASGGCSAPSVARGPDGTLLVVWTRKDGVFGRIWKTDGTLFPDGEITIAPGGSAPRVAGSASGFRVVYQGTGAGDPNGIYIAPVSVAGEVGGAVLVNTIKQDLQDQPDIAMLADGASLVTWHSGGDVHFQRFDSSGKPIAGDQDAPLNTTGIGAAIDQRHPVVAAGSGFYLVAWEVAAPNGNDIAARFVGGASGFGYNSVSGQNDEFVATDAKIKGDRRGPAVALGSYAVVGWEDGSADHHGVFVRRFPAPTQ
ncbi:RTX toxin [Minicystis rosea]|nr:RTX toxin [Minicystis rosea]